MSASVYRSARGTVAITASATTFTQPAWGFFVQTAGTLTFVTEGGQTCSGTWPVGLVPISVKSYSAGGTAVGYFLR
jgi:hypothetical protein